MLLILSFFLFPVKLQAKNNADYKVCIQPIYPYIRPHLSDVEIGIAKLYGFSTEVLYSIGLPSSISLNGPLQRYKGEDILAYLKEKKPARCDFIIGFFNSDFTIPDIITGKPRGVFGAANFVGGTLSIVSTYRMHVLLGNEIEKFLIKTVNHEIGHMLGVSHHDDPKCMMKKWEKELDHNSLFLCVETREYIEESLEISLPVWNQIDFDESISPRKN